MISLGQSNTIVSVPAFTTHSEMTADALREAGITPTMIRFAVGDEDPADLLMHFIAAARLAIDPDVPDFSAGFMKDAQIDNLIRECYVGTHRRYAESKPVFRQ